MGRSNAEQTATSKRAGNDSKGAFMKVHGWKGRVRAASNVHAVAVIPTLAAGRGHMVIQWASHSSERCECDVGV